MFEFDEMALDEFAKVKVVGTGNDGLKAINYMIDSGLEGVDFLVLDSDAQVLRSSKATEKILIDSNTPEKLFEALNGFNAVFVVTGLDNSTGENIASSVAKFAKMLGILTIAPIVIYADTPDKKLNEFNRNVDTLITISRDDVKNVYEVLFNAVRAISDLIAVPEMINLDFADVQSIMSNAGKALIGFGEATGENATVEAVKKAVTSSLLEVVIPRTHGFLINIMGAADSLSMLEINEAVNILQDEAPPDAETIWGVSVNDSFGNKVVATIIATRFDNNT